jgi:RNA polymerase sigma-70 factor (ECF subfamily)
MMERSGSDDTLTRRQKQMNYINEEQLYREYHDKIFGYLLNRIGNREEAEDITSEVFIKALKYLGKYDPEKAAVSTWIYTIMRNTLTDHFRSSRASDELSEDMVSNDNVEESYLREEALGELAMALKKLPQDERDIIIMRYYDDCSLTEISEKLNISYGMTKVKHKAALGKLKDLL